MIRELLWEYNLKCTNIFFQGNDSGTKDLSIKSVALWTVEGIYILLGQTLKFGYSVYLPSPNFVSLTHHN